jgi:hypothetical protein
MIPNNFVQRLKAYLVINFYYFKNVKIATFPLLLPQILRGCFNSFSNELVDDQTVYGISLKKYKAFLIQRISFKTIKS